MPALVVMGVVAAGSISLVAAPAHAAVPEYDILEVPAPQPQAGGFFGERMRTLGDVDGDGARDVLISSPRFDAAGAGGAITDAGRVYVVSGRTRALLHTIDHPDRQANATFGFWSANLGSDVDGDAVADFVTSAPGQVIDGARVGRVYIYSARTGSLLRTISPPESLGATGSFGADFGGNLIAPGDLSGDGIGDFVATASGAFGGSGAVYAFNGKTGELLYKVSNPSTQSSSFGFGASELGDVNRDGFGDYQVGAPRFDEGGVADVGRSYTIDGDSGSVIYTLLNPQPEANDRFGQADADGVSLGDITGDGTPDIYVDSFLADAGISEESAPFPNAGKVFLFDGATGNLIRQLRDPVPTAGATFGASNASGGDLDKDGLADSIVSSRGGNKGRVTIFGGLRLETVLKVFEDPGDQDGALFGSSIASPGDVNGDGLPDYIVSARRASVGGVRDVGTAYAFISRAPPAPPPPPAPPAPPLPTPPAVNPCGTPGAAGYLYPAKMRLSRARVLREERRLDVLAPITSRAEGDVAVTFFGDDRVTRFDGDVTQTSGALDAIRVNKKITRGQARLGTGIVRIEYQGDGDTRGQSIRLRAASRRAELDVEQIGLKGDRFSARGSVTRRARGVVRFSLSYLDELGRPRVYHERAKIQRGGDWELENDQVPLQLARCGGYLSVQFTGYFPRRIRGEQLGYELNPGQTRRP